MNIKVAAFTVSEKSSNTRLKGDNSNLNARTYLDGKKIIKITLLKFTCLNQCIDSPISFFTGSHCHGTSQT